MFREIYHQANDDIPVNQELLNSILNKKPVKKVRFLYPRVTIAASLIILSASVLAYPHLKNNLTENSGSNLEPHQITIPATTPTIVPEPTVTPDMTEDNRQPETKLENNALPNTKNVSDTRAENKPNTQVENKTPSPKTDNQSTDTQSTVEPLQEGNSIGTDEPVIPTAPEPIDNTPDTAQTHEGSVLGTTSDELTRDSLITECWSKEKYFEYLGVDITPKVPQDLAEITVSEKNMTLYADTKIPYFDVWSLKYASQDCSRLITVKLTKNIADAEKRISESEDIIEIDGTKAITSYFENSRHTEAVKDGIGYTIDTFGLTQEEFDELCQSILIKNV